MLTLYIRSYTTRSQTRGSKGDTVNLVIGLRDQLDLDRLHVCRSADRQRFCNRLPARGSFIPGTKQPFLYWQDFYCQKWGNTVGHAADARGIHRRLWPKTRTSHIPGGCFLVRDRLRGRQFIFRVLCLAAKHKPDWGFPDGRRDQPRWHHPPVDTSGSTSHCHCSSPSWHLQSPLPELDSLALWHPASSSMPLTWHKDL
jgi:hypothetical protein